MFILGNSSAIEQWYDTAADSVSDFVNQTGNFFDGVIESAEKSYGRSGASDNPQMDALKFIIAAYLTYTVIAISTFYYQNFRNNGEEKEDELVQTHTDDEPQQCKCLSENVVSERTARYIAKIKERHKKKMTSVNCAFDRKNELIEKLKILLSENYEALERIYMDKTDLSHNELLTLISCVLPSEWTQFEYHEEMEDLTSDYRLQNLKKMRESRRTAKRVHVPLPPPPFVEQVD